MAVKNFRDLMPDLISDFEANSSQDVYLCWDASVYHTNKNCAKDRTERDLYKIPLKLAEWLDYTLCDSKVGKHLCNAAE